MAASTRETLRQFTIRRVREIATEYGVTQREVRETSDSHRWYDEWWNQIRYDASGGVIIDERTLDALDPMHRRHIAHDYPRAMPDRYVFPEARRPRSVVEGERLRAIRQGG